MSYCLDIIDSEDDNEHTDQDPRRRVESVVDFKIPWREKEKEDDVEFFMLQNKTYA